MQTVRNLTRRKLRGGLTVSGIVIGILALTTMGALASNFNEMVGGGASFYGDHVMVKDASDSGGIMANGVVPLSKVAQVESVDGVAAAFPEILFLANRSSVAVINLSFPDYISSRDPRESAYQATRASLRTGHDLTPGSRGEVVLGATFASEFKKQVGDTIDLPVRPAEPPPGFVNHRLTVVGILATTRTLPDSGAFVGLRDAQMMLWDTMPAAIRGQVDQTQLANSINAYGPKGTAIAALDQLAARITNEVAGVKAGKPSEQVAAFKSGGAVLSSIDTVAALLAVIIGGLSVFNTMVMAVGERVREIGLKKALGATNTVVLREVLVEAGLIGFLGGAIGFLLGAAVALLINLALPPSQPSLFLVTPGLALIAIGLATGLGTTAGLLPALRAARLDPVTALRAL